MSDDFSGAGVFPAGTTGVCFLWICASPSGRSVAAAAGGFVKTEGLERSSESEKEQGRCDENADVEMDQAYGFQKRVRRGHIPFLHKKMKYDEFGPISSDRPNQKGLFAEIDRENGLKRLEQ